MRNSFAISCIRFASGRLRKFFICIVDYNQTHIVVCIFPFGSVESKMSSIVLL